MKEELRFPEIPGIKLTEEQERHIRNAFVNVALEGMLPSQEVVRLAMLVEAGVLTKDEAVQELAGKYVGTGRGRKEKGAAEHGRT